ncbi:MAG: hypothetical protein AAFW69_10315 [Pseudomonadota bacterium]
MKIAALVLGVLGGVLGMITGFFVYGWISFVDWVRTDFPEAVEQVEDPERLQILGVAAPILALAGGAMAGPRPVPAALLLALSTAGMYWAFGLGVFTIFPIVMTGLAALLALFGRATQEPGTL